MATNELRTITWRFTLDKMQEMTPGENYHTDPEAAKRAGFEEPNAGSAQFLPVLYEMIEDNFGLTPETMRGTMSVRFRRPMLSGRDTIAGGQYDDAGVPDASGTRYSVQVALTQEGEGICVGTAEIVVPAS